MPPLTANDILGPGGSIARRLENYEHREQQLEMAAAVSDALAQRKHLLCEAGTGVGKSFGYLVPAILAATSENESKKLNRVVVSTHTISLQEQLLLKDLPVLNSVIPREFTVSLVKGRGNYISLRRLHRATEKAGTLWNEDLELSQLRQIHQWSKQTKDGSTSDLPFKPWGSVWDEVQSDSGNCLGKKCPTHKECFFYSARQRAKNATILVVNHAIFFSDLALRQMGAQIIPDYDAVILDEAHTVESVAGDHMGLRVTSGQVDYTLNKLYNDRTNKGLLVADNLRSEQQATQDCHYLADEFFGDIRDWIEKRPGNGRVRSPEIVKNPLSPALGRLSRMLKDFGGNQTDPSKRQDYIAAADRLASLAGDLEAWRKQSLEDDAVYWVENSKTRRGLPRTTLASAPLDIGPLLREQLFNRCKSVILTSATLTTGAKSFDFVKSRLGLTQTNTIKLGSPFNYRQQAKLILLRGMPEPSDADRLPSSLSRDDQALRRANRWTRLRALYELRRDAANGIGPDIVAGRAKHEAIVSGRATPAKRIVGTVQNQRAERAAGHRQFLAGSRRSGGRTSKRHYHATSVQRSRSAAARGKTRSDPARRRQPISRLPIAAGDHEVPTGLRPPHPNSH